MAVYPAYPPSTVTLQPLPSLSLPPTHYPSTLPTPSPSPPAPGLAFLSQLDHLLVQQHLELLEILCGCETANRYKILDPTSGRHLYTALETTNFCSRNLFGNARPFHLEIRDASKRELIHLYRPLACGSSACCPCCPQSIQVFCPPGQLAGTVEETTPWGRCTPKYSVKNAEGKQVFVIEGPGCGYCAACCNVEFGILEVEGGRRRVGKITKKWEGLARELFSDADSFGLSFPPGLEVTMKAVLLGALFLIDFVFFEKSESFLNYFG